MGIETEPNERFTPNNTTNAAVSRKNNTLFRVVCGKTSGLLDFKDTCFPYCKGSKNTRLCSGSRSGCIILIKSFKTQSGREAANS